MSMHTMIATAYVENLEPATKLVLMAIADSADEHSGEAAPGYPKLRAWSGLSKRQLTRVIKTLKDDRLIEAGQHGQKYRRASWYIFPDGIPAIPHPDEVAARFADESQVDTRDPLKLVPPVDNPNSQVDTRDPLSNSQVDISRSQVDIAMATLQSSTSVIKAHAPKSRVDKPPLRRTGFPGRRPVVAEPSRAAPTRCHVHPEHFFPCHRCDAGASPAEESRAEAAKIRAMMQASRQTAINRTEEIRK